MNTAMWDLVVVGAGVAGLAAARTALELGLSTVVLEAKDRIGGRAWTDTQSLGVPWERGANWLHNAESGRARPSRSGTPRDRNFPLFGRQSHPGIRSSGTPGDRFGV